MCKVIHERELSPPDTTAWSQVAGGGTTSSYEG
jgi:hypothetical protein